MINTLIVQFENDLVNLVNASPIPIACKKQVLSNVYHEVEKATERAIANEATSASKEENADALPES